MTPNMAKSDVTRKLSILAIVIFVFLVIWWSRRKSDPSASYQEQSTILQVEKFSPKAIKYETIRKLCYDDHGPSKLDDLSAIVESLRDSRHYLCKQQYKNFKSIFRLRTKSTKINLSPAVQKVLQLSFKIDSKLAGTPEKQALLIVDNIYTLDSVVFNLPRLRFPDVWGNISESVRTLVEESRPGCDFCAAPTNTAADKFGRLESSHAWIVSNAFKIAKYHGKVLSFSLH